MGTYGDTGTGITVNMDISNTYLIRSYFSSNQTLFPFKIYIYRIYEGDKIRIGLPDTMGVDRRVDRGTNPPYFLELGGQSMLCPPAFLKRICVSFCGCVYCNFCYNCHLAKTVNQSHAKSSLLWLIMSLCPYR